MPDDAERSRGHKTNEDERRCMQHKKTTTARAMDDTKVLHTRVCLSLQRGSACLDEVCGFRGTQSEAAGEWLRVTARTRKVRESKRQSALHRICDKALRSIPYETCRPGGEKHRQNIDQRKSGRRRKKKRGWKGRKLETKLRGRERKKAGWGRTYLR